MVCHRQEHPYAAHNYNLLGEARPGPHRPAKVHGRPGGLRGGTETVPKKTRAHACTFLRGVPPSVSFFEAVILKQGLSLGPRESVGMERLRPVPAGSDSIASGGAGYCSPGDSRGHPVKNFCSKSWGASKLCPGGNVSCGCPREEKEGWKPLCFVFVLHILLNKRIRAEGEICLVYQPDYGLSA